MKKYFLILLALVSFTASSQYITPLSTPDRATQFLGGVKADSTFNVPVRDRTPIYPNLPLQGRLQMNPDTDLLEYHTGTEWRTLVPLKYLGYAFPEDYGAIANDGIDDTAAIIASLAANDKVAITGEYLATNFELVANKTLLGYGETSRIVTTTDNTLIKIVGANTTIQNITFVGSGKDSGLINQIAVWRDRGPSSQSERQNTKILNCNFYNFGGAGYYSTRHRGLNYMGGTALANCFARGNNVGFYCPLQGEYNSFSNCKASENNDGVYFIGGNNNWVGGEITGNINGFRLGAGLNDGHCTIEGAKINHNITYNILAENVANGYRFTNCDIYNSAIRIIGSTNIRFNICELGFTGLEPEPLTIISSTVRFTDNYFIKTPTPYTETTSTVEWLENKFIQPIIPGIKNYTLADLQAQISDIAVEKHITKTANYTLLPTDFGGNGAVVVEVDASAGPVTITLLPPASMPGKSVFVIKTDVSGNAVTVKGDGSTNINNSNTQVFGLQFQGCMIKPNTALTQYYMHFSK